MCSTSLRILVTGICALVLTSGTRAQELPTPDIAIGPLAYQNEFIESVGPSGVRDNGDLIEDNAPEGGLLVGVEVYSRPRSSNEHSGFRAIYQVGKTLSRGQLIGREGNNSTKQLLAKPGFVVGGLTCEMFADRIRGIRLVYYQLERGKLLRETRYESDVIGELRRRSDVDVDVASPIVGIHAYVDRFETFPDEPADVHVNGLKLQVLSLDKMRLAAAEPTAIPLVKKSAELKRHELILNKDRGEAYYQSEAPLGGILIGFHVCDAKNGGSVSRSVRLDPIYQIENQYEAGKPSRPIGETQSKLVLARPGFAVCGVHFTNGILDRIKFAELNPETLGFRNPYDEILFESADDRGDLVEQEWMCGGPIFGIEYQYSNAGINAVAFSTDAKTRTRGDANTKGEPRLNARGYPVGAAPVIRTWTSDRGKQVVAALVSFNGKHVWIRKDAGQPFALPLDKYSVADQDFLTQLPQLQD